MSSSNIAAVPIDDPLVVLLSYPELLERQTYLQHRLSELEIPPPTAPRRHNHHHHSSSTRGGGGAISASATKDNHEEVPNLVPYVDKIDTHTDYLLKEMQWLSADFSSERKRHSSQRRKVCSSIRSYFASLESRRLKSFADAEMKRRKLAARIGRDCIKAWWNKLDKIVTYKQKVSMEETRRKAMNQQLVKLVQQTERYGSRWRNSNRGMEHHRDGGGGSSASSNYHWTNIERALATGRQYRRRAKGTVRDYAQFVRAPRTGDSTCQANGNDTYLYGESTEDSGSDASYEPSSSDEDETTLRQAELEERRLRGLIVNRNTVDNDEDDNMSFRADPLELQKLREEETMDLDIVLQRLRDDAAHDRMAGASDASEGQSATDEPPTKRVKFASSVQFTDAGQAALDSRPATLESGVDPGEDADDDGDASEVEDYRDDDDVVDELEEEEQGTNDDEDDEEFVAVEPEADDETTIALEESLPQDMSAQEEIRLLQAENELSVDELRAKYAAAFQEQQGEDDDLANGSRTSSVPHSSSSEESVEEEMMDVVDDESQEASYAVLISTGANDEDDGDAEEFQPDEREEVDDETTMEAEENLGRDMSYEDEIALLKRESEMSIDELRALYSQSGAESAESDVDADDESATQRRSSYFEDAQEDQENDEEFLPAAEEKDDETTIEAEERLGREMSVEDELALLQKEGEEPIEALRDRYKSIHSSSQDRPEERADNSDSDQAVEMDVEREDKAASESEGNTSEAGRVALEALEASAERARTTRASRPYILAPWVKLREYQQVGLNWLVSLQSQRLNGVLADEMGLGKTLQTIALLAYLACYKGIWGPHLIIVPTSVILNWENELKRFAPALKVLCYYGPAKRRKELRSGWTKTNWYHVVITSYQLAVQDAFAFKRKKWYYLVLDEAQNIKNFQSQRWQTLINFNTQRRLLLTGTPLQNSLMELWSLLHFLMPYIFRSRKQFSYWFANPMNSIIEGKGNQSENIVNRLHGIIRPFVLRRLKKDVEAQMPGKFEHIVKCQLSRRQMFIYEEFLSRSSTRQALRKGGNFLGMMNVLMQLRKVCNHPDLFEPRSVLTPFVTDPIRLSVPACVIGIRSNGRLNCLMPALLCQLWSGSTGIPSMDAALRHDKLESDELLELERPLQEPASDSELQNLLSSSGTQESLPSSLIKLLETLHKRKYDEKCQTTKFLNGLNHARCRAASFPYARRLLTGTTISMPLDPYNRHRVLSSPAALLSMKRSLEERVNGVEELISNFVFCVPNAESTCPILDVNATCSSEISESCLDTVLRKPAQEALRPFRKAQARLSSFFPDRKLIQFDAGKLQTLAELLRELKRGGHRALIFTQMSKMLDILEAFLNLNGHTYLRLDGSTGVERRQRLMDRFNNDPKVFCFILSTRSGGLGINLTGADTVVFYDQDWNPAMDAQAQDRAHRIGQTREVHIYRLVTEHSIEENILIKAQQKRNLDILVMDKGNFDASQLFGHSEEAKTSSVSEGAREVYTKGGLRSILGVYADDAQSDAEIEDKEAAPVDESMEKAMASLEDADDLQALRGAQQEAAEELREFDESAEIKKGSDSEEDAEDDTTDRHKQDKIIKHAENSDEKGEEDLEREFAAWQHQVGLDAASIEASLAPTERYGLKFRELIDPFVSIFAVQEYRQKVEADEEAENEIDIEDIERSKELDEQKAFESGDLLGTHPRPDTLLRQRDLYFRERARLKASQKRRTLTGENWELRKDSISKHPFWYNVDTGEAIWDKPRVLVDLEAHERADIERFAAIPLKALVNVMSFLSPFPDRNKCAAVCGHWRNAATDPSFVLHVYPVEMGAYAREESKMEHNHYKSISDAIAVACPGDTIELGDGHYWANNDLVVEFPLRFVGDESNASNVIVEMGGSLVWRAQRGFCEGVTFRRPKLSSGMVNALPILRLESNARMDLRETVIDNVAGTGLTVSLTGFNSKGLWERVLVRGGQGGISLSSGSSLELLQCTIRQTGNFGIMCETKSRAKLTRCSIEDVAGSAVKVKSASSVRLLKCYVSVLLHGNVLAKEPGSTVSCSNNTAPASSLRTPIPGFRLEERT